MDYNGFLLVVGYVEPYKQLQRKKSHIISTIIKKTKSFHHEKMINREKKEKR